MRLRLKKSTLCQAVAVTALYLAGSSASAQKPCPPPPCCQPAPGFVPSMPGTEGRVPPEGTGTGEGAGAAASPSFGDLASGAGVGSSAALGSPGGYLDSAIPQTQFRLRNDAQFGTNRFDRAEYMYGTWAESSFHNHAFVNNGQVDGIFAQDSKVRGTAINSDAVNADIIKASLEVAVNQRFSAFVEVPYRFVHFGGDIEDTPETAADRNAFPEPADGRNQITDPKGLSDISAGFKYALIAEPDCRFLTFQFRVYFPSGDTTQGLGTGHYSIEPSLLWYQRLTDQLVAQGQLTYWVPINGGAGAGNVFQYGAALGYDVIQLPKLRVTPVVELVGWTVIGGTEAIEGPVPGQSVLDPKGTGATGAVFNGVFLPDSHFFQSATGDTIINAKVGVRTYFGCDGKDDVYIGYGHALTGDRWYKDIVSVEYRHSF